MTEAQTRAPTAAKKPAIDTAKLEKGVSWIGARLREPSTYAGLGALLGLLGLGSDPGLIKDIGMIGLGTGGLIAVVLPEGK